MSFTVSIIVIFLLVFMAIFIQYIVSSTELNDPTKLLPVAMITSSDTTKLSFETFSKNVNINRRLLFCINDVANSDELNKYVKPENIFISTRKNMNTLVDNNIYKPSGPDDIFWVNGYYKKHLPNSTIDVICFDYDISVMKHLIHDLENLLNGRTVYIVSNNFRLDKLDDKYLSVISGIFTTTSIGNFTTLHQWKNKIGVSNMWNIPLNMIIEVDFTFNKPLLLSQTDVKK
jgi:hypothetical protein